MKSNSVKKGLSLAAAIFGLIIGIIQLVWWLVDFFEFKSFFGFYPFDFWEIMAWGLAITAIILSGLSFKAFKINVDGTLNQRLGIRITLAIVIGVSMIVNFICSFMVLAVLCLIGLGIGIAAMCIPTVQLTGEETQKNIAMQGVAATKASAENTAFMAKVRELKRMKDLFVITEEQFADSFEKLTKDLKEEIIKGMPQNEI